MISIGIISGHNRIETPGGTKKVKKCAPCLMNPNRVTPRNTTIAITKVTTMWLVKVKLYGIIPRRLPNRMNMNSAKMNGK